MSQIFPWDLLDYQRERERVRLREQLRQQKYRSELSNSQEKQDTIHVPRNLINTLRSF